MLFKMLLFSVCLTRISSAYADAPDAENLDSLLTERKWSIAVLVTGAGTGLLATGVAVSAKYFSLLKTIARNTDNYNDQWSTPLLVSGLGLTAISAAIGVPWLVSVQRKIRRAQHTSIYPTLHAHVDAHTSILFATWRFP